MCGIAGAVWSEPDGALSVQTLQKMIEALRHRGPDEQGTFTASQVISHPYPPTPGVALGSARLSIIDVAGSQQPIANEDGSVQVVFNGEIYNYRELRQRLEGSGHVFRTDGDTEVLVHLYEDEGERFLEHLIGMFAIALWDRNGRQLLLARDRLGQKPLVYSHRLGRLLFASELKALMEVPDVAREIDPGAVDAYLMYGYVPHPLTIFKGVQKLPPGHFAVFHDGRLHVAPYWQPNPADSLLESSENSIEKLREQLTNAVRLRLRSDVPLGTFLSGGVDSSIITALAQQQTGESIRTFTIGFPEQEYDESMFARRVAQHLGTSHHDFRVTPNCVEVLPRLIWHFDEPFADSSAIPTYYLAQETRTHVKVALSGDGGDELFGGYDRYLAMEWAAAADRLPRAIALLANGIAQMAPAPGRQKSLRRRIKRLLEVAATPADRRYAELVSIFNEWRRASLYRDEFLAKLPDRDPAEHLNAALRRAGKLPIPAVASLADLVTYLPDDICFKMDMATMAHGLECRQPMLDHRVVKLAVAMKGQGRRKKWILKRAFGHLVPGEVFRRRKTGFGVPLDHWFRGELKSLAFDTLLSQRAIERGYFRKDAIERLLGEHTGGRFDHSARLWSLVVLEFWHREWIDRR